MVDATIISGIIGAAGVLAGVYLTSWTTRKADIERRKYEEKKWYLDHFLDRKIDIMTSFYLALNEWYFSVCKYIEQPPNLTRYNETIGSKETTYWSLFKTALIYFEEDEINEVKLCSDILSKSSFHIRDRATAGAPIKPVSPEAPTQFEIDEAVKKAVIIIKKHLSPSLLNLDTDIEPIIPDNSNITNRFIEKK